MNLYSGSDEKGEKFCTMASSPQDPPDTPIQRGPAGFLRRRWLWLAVALLFILVVAAGVDSLFIEPFRIEVTHFDIQAPISAPLKIAQLSDLHTHGMGRNERHLLAILDAEKPDAIVITGDCLGNLAGNYEWCKQLYEKLHAPLGVWFVRGNWEHDHPLHRERLFYHVVGVNLLVNASAAIRPDVWLVGLDDPSSGTARLDAALANVPPDAYKIAIFHSPGYFDRMGGRVNLCLTGHTHGGQVRLPFLPPLWLPKGCGRFVEGWYESRGSKMYVNRGLGMSNLPIRFLCRPEISFFTLHP
jgi:predicted MPP superfamily phosphohydrolase